MTTTGQCTGTTSGSASLLQFETLTLIESAADEKKTTQPEDAGNAHARYVVGSVNAASREDEPAAATATRHGMKYVVLGVGVQPRT